MILKILLGFLKPPKNQFNHLQKLENQVYEAYRNREIDKEISITEKLGQYFLAGYKAKQYGLFKKALENFKKSDQLDNIERIKEIVYPETLLTCKEINSYEKIIDNNNLIDLLKIKKQDRYKHYSTLIKRLN